MTKIIGIVSGKGGVGKTFLTSNLGVTLANMGKDVIILDSNVTTPNLGIHLGVPLFPITLQDVIKGKAHIRDAIYEHDSGLKIIPSGIALKDLKGVDIRELPNTVLELLGTTELVLLDISAGLGREALSAMEASDEIILVTNPDLPAVTDALKAARLAEQIGTKVRGVVINRVAGRKYEMSTQEIMSMLDTEVLAEIPEDRRVQEAIAERMPVVNHSPSSKASREVEALAHRLLGEEYETRKTWLSRLNPFSR